MSKKKNNKKPEKQVPQEPSRRSFLNKLWIGLGVLAVIEFVGLVFAYLSPRKAGVRLRESGTIVEAGPVENFPLNSVTAFVRGKFYLCRFSDGGFLAVSRKCTHLGCTVPWLEKEKKFACPCHGSAFDIRGEVISPPAPRALDVYPLTIENNVVKVVSGKEIKRSAFRSDQVVYAKKA
ncbi:ubiquinol-cytochrome c reductase iron-sulfur subunit [Thermodesulfobacteriota bacterium]